MNHKEEELRPFWRKLITFDWKLGIWLVLAVCIPRFFLVLNANESANYQYIGMIMMVSAVVPFLLLTKYGRRSIGIVVPKSYRWLILACILGVAFSFLLYFIGQWMYGDSIDNWYVYIGKSYDIPTEITSHDKLVLFAIMAITGMIFSPVGEELFFRGIVHASFSKSVGDTKASLIDAAAFALTHISHFGLVFVHNGWKFLFAPAAIWVIGMFVASIIFYLCKKKSGSLLGAIIGHAAFNLGMIYCIFYLL